MKKITTLFLVLILVFALAGCGTTAGEGTATTTEEIFTLSYEQEVAEVVQWTMVNIINKNSAKRYASAHLYEDVKSEIVSYISSLPQNIVPTSFSIKLISADLFEIEVIF